MRQAETQLAAAAARIGVAKADYFPRVFLTGDIGVGGLVLNGQTFGPQGLVSTPPSATVPIFNSGRVGASVEAARARAEAAVLQYQQTILTADARRVPQAPRGPRAAGTAHGGRA